MFLAVTRWVLAVLVRTFCLVCPPYGNSGLALGVGSGEKPKWRFLDALVRSLQDRPLGPRQVVLTGHGDTSEVFVGREKRRRRRVPV